MKPIFNIGPSLELRLGAALILAVSLLIADGVYEFSKPFRVTLNALVYPVKFVATLPGVLLEQSSERLKTQSDLLEERTQLINEVMLLREKAQRFAILEEENMQLRDLLAAPLAPEFTKIIAELSAVDNSPYSQKIIVNKGALDGLFISQPVLDANGIVGQVTDVAPTDARVLLITDISHAIPVRVLRNNLSLIANGTGNLDRLNVDYVAHSADLQTGDVLISSGLGNVFPAGYPVAVVDQIIRDEGKQFATVDATPLANLDRIRYLLLLNTQEANLDPSQSREQVREEAQSND
jgi:rod shape-determining protein MreC